MNNVKTVVLGTLLALASPLTFAAVAVDDFYTVEQDGLVFFYPSRNDSVDNGFGGFGDLSFEVTQGEGTVQVGSDGPTFEPAPGFVGPVEILYTIEDSAGTDSATVFIDVQETTDSFTAVDDNFYMPENTGTVTYNVTQNDQVSAGTDFPPSLAQVSSPTAEGGTVTLTQDSTTSVDYTPPEGFTGTDTFTYTLVADNDETDQATVTVYVGVEPDQPDNITMPENLTREEARTFAVTIEACEQDEDNSLPCDAIADLTPEEKKQLAQQLSGRHAKLQARTMRQLQRQQSNNIDSRLQDIRAGRNQVSLNGLNAAVMGETLPLGKALQGQVNDGLRGGSAGDGELQSPWGLFINGDITVGESNQSTTRPSYDQEGYDITFGADYRVSDTVVLGAAAGLGESDTDFNSMDGTQNAQSVSLAAFGNYYPADNLYIDGLAMWMQGDLDVQRRIAVAAIDQELSSDTQSQQLTAAANVGYEFNHKRWQSSVYGRLEYSDLSVDGYTETGGSLALSVDEQNTDSFSGALGTRLGYVFSWSRGVISPTLELEYIKESSDDFNITNRFADAIPAGQFSINAEEPDTAYMSLSTSASAVFSGGKSAFVRYETLLLQDNYDYSAFTVGFRMEF